MHKNPGSKALSETNRLLSELDRAIDQYSVLRDIVNQYQQLRNLESITGPSPKTNRLRKEIARMESILSARQGPVSTT